MDERAVWYGSLGIGIISSDSKLSVDDGVSSWGIRGSVKASEGVTTSERLSRLFPESLVVTGWNH